MNMAMLTAPTAVFVLQSGATVQACTLGAVAVRYRNSAAAVPWLSRGREEATFDCCANAIYGRAHSFISLSARAARSVKNHPITTSVVMTIGVICIAASR